MRIAIPVAEGKLAMHFGHCEKFAIIDADQESKKIVSQTLITPPPHAPGVLPKFLADEGVNVIIAGGMGSRAQSMFSDNGIAVIVGANSEIPEKLVTEYLAGVLQAGENVCDH